MCATNAFLRSLGVEIYASGHRRGPDEVKAQAVAETLRPGASVSDVAAQFGIQPNQLSGWRRLTKDGELVLPADACGGNEAVFAPLVLREAEPLAAAAIDLRAEGEIRIKISDVALHLDADTPATRIAGIVRALGAPS